MWLYKAVPKSERLYWIIVPLFVFTVISLTSYLVNKSYSSPIISGSIDGVNIHPMPEDSTGVLLIISVRNSPSGAPTILEKWIVIAETMDGNKYVGKNLLIPKEMTLVNEDGKKTKYSNKDAIYNKTIKDPVRSGEMIRGILRAQFEGIDRKILNKTGTKLYVECSDVLGNKYIFPAELAKPSNSKVYYPGMKLP